MDYEIFRRFLVLRNIPYSLKSNGELFSMIKSIYAYYTLGLQVEGFFMLGFGSYPVNFVERPTFSIKRSSL